MRIFLSLLTVFIGVDNCLARPANLETLSELAFFTSDVCSIQDFTFPKKLVSHLTFDTTMPITVDIVEQVADEFTWGTRFAKLYIPDFTTNRYQSGESFFRLAKAMRDLNINEIILTDLRPFAIQKLEQLKLNRTIGECYTINTMEGPLVPSWRTVNLSADVQTRIDRLFKDSQSVLTTQNKLSDRETKLIAMNILSLEEIIELRALRKATEIFEQNTILSNDMAGGFLNNLWSEAFGGFQQLCTNEALTYQAFVEVLKSRGLLKHFYTGDWVSKRPSIIKDWSKGGHVATRLISERTGKIFVLDSWYEMGGKAAHIMTYEDWYALPITHFGNLNFNDVVELVP